MIGNEEVKRLEQIWFVLVSFFNDLTQRKINVDVAAELRNSKTSIHYIKTEVSRPQVKDPASIYSCFENLQASLGKIKADLISAALNVGESYLKDWLSRIDKAERAELDYVMIYEVPKFAPRMPVDLEEGWVRLTLPEPVAEERLQDIAEQLGVIIGFEDDLHIVISGEKTSVKRAAQEIYDLSKKKL